MTILPIHAWGEITREKLVRLKWEERRASKYDLYYSAGRNGRKTSKHVRVIEEAQ
jgi:hypothetical protein